MVLHHPDEPGSDQPSESFAIGTRTSTVLAISAANECARLAFMVVRYTGAPKNVLTMITQDLRFPNRRKSRSWLAHCDTDYRRVSVFNV